MEKIIKEITMTDKQAIRDMQFKLKERTFALIELREIFDSMAADLGVLPEPAPEPEPEPEPEPAPEAKDDGPNFFND